MTLSAPQPCFCQSTAHSAPSARQCALFLQRPLCKGSTLLACAGCPRRPPCAAVVAARWPMDGAWYPLAATAMATGAPYTAVPSPRCLPSHGRPVHLFASGRAQPGRAHATAASPGSHARRYPGAYGGGGGGGGFGNILLYGILAVFVVTALQGLLNRGDTDDYGAPAPSLLLTPQVMASSGACCCTCVSLSATTRLGSGTHLNLQGSS